MTIPPPYEALQAAAQRAFLIALRQGLTLEDIEAEVRGTSAKGFTPDVAVLEVAVSAMDLAGIDRERPLEKAALIGQHLPELRFDNQRALQTRTAYALNAVSAIRGGLQPDIVHDMYWWNVRDIVDYAVIAAVAYVRACADRRGQQLTDFIDDLLVHLGLPT